MFNIVFALLLFATSVFIHILYCRRTSKHGLQAKTFIFIATGALGVYIAGVFILSYAHLFNPDSLWGMPFRISAGLILMLLVPVYLCFYVLTQLTSPSKKILLTIARRGQLSQQEILDCVQEEDFIGSRLRDLYASGCVVLKQEGYVLTSQGQKIALMLRLMQLALGRNVGG